MIVNGIEYCLPKVTLLHDSGVGVAEIAARTCYDSFGNSEHVFIQEFQENLEDEEVTEDNIDSLGYIENSDLLNSLAWVHHHHSIIEHATVSYLVKGTSRGVLQEHARHRLQAISVRSTRYTMSGIINAFVATLADKRTIPGLRKTMFIDRLLKYDMFVTTGEDYNRLEIGAMFDKLNFQYEGLGCEEFLKLAVAKSSLEFMETTRDEETLFDLLENGKKKRNVGDAFKHIVTDNWKVDMVVTFNIRSLKNYFDLRDSGAAFFQIRWLAEEMKKVTPVKYLKLIDKDFKI